MVVTRLFLSQTQNTHIVCMWYGELQQHLELCMYFVYVHVGWGVGCMCGGVCSVFVKICKTTCPVFVLICRNTYPVFVLIYRSTCPVFVLICRSTCPVFVLICRSTCPVFVLICRSTCPVIVLICRNSCNEEGSDQEECLCRAVSGV